MKTSFKVGIVILLLVYSGFIIYSYDRSDDGIKLMSDDAMDELLESTEKVGVYYNLDNPEKTYVRDENNYDNFVEVEING